MPTEDVPVLRRNSATAFLWATRAAAGLLLSLVAPCICEIDWSARARQARSLMCAMSAPWRMTTGAGDST